MKKTLLSLFSLIALGMFAQNSSGGPDSFGYTYKTSLHPSGPAYSWFDITTTGSLVTGLADDNFVGPFSISGFPYYSSNPTQLYIGSNGYISFQPINIASTNAQFPAIPGSSAPNNFIAPMLTDLNFGGASSNPAVAYFYNQGDTICISFEKVPFWVNNTSQYSGDNSFQIILNKADSSITFNYKQQIGFPDPTYTANFVSIGIENQSGSTGIQYLRGDTFPNPLTTIRFDYPNIVQSVTDLELNYNNNSGNGAEFLSLNTPYTPMVSVKNVGNQNVTNPISITTQILNTNGIVVSNSSQTISSLASGVDSLVSFSSYTPISIGKFIVRSYISQVQNDAVRSNDTNIVFFKTIDPNASIQLLDYTNGITGPGIGWTGGNGGCAIYIEPPYYPAYVKASNFYITTTGSPAVGFHSILYNDGGRGPGQGTILDSTYIPPTAIVPGTYHSVVPANPIAINSGGVYLLWLMGGDGINLGRSFVTPTSNRTYEVLFGAWSDYRDKTTQDFLMNIEISPLPVGLDEISSESTSSLFPNPASNQLTLLIETPLNNKIIEVIDVNGRTQNVKILRSDDKINFYTEQLPSGVYFVRIGKELKQFIIHR